MKDFFLLVQNLGSDLKKRTQRTVKPWFSPTFAILRRRQGCPKKTRSDVLQATFGGKISKFIRFATTDSIGVSFKSSCLQDLSCVTLKSVGKCLFENNRIGKECNG